MKNIFILFLSFLALESFAQVDSDSTSTNQDSVNVTANTVQEESKTQNKTYNGTEIIIWTGYQTNSNMSFYEGKLKFYGGQNYGAELAIAVKPEFKIRLGYSRLESDVRFTTYFPSLYPDRTESLINEYYNLGFEMNMPKGKVVPYGLFNLGVTTYKSDLFGSSTPWAFNIGAGVGAKLFLTDFLGLRFQARALLPFKPQGLSVYAGSGGSGVGVSSKAMILGDFTFGVFLHINKK